MLFLFISQNEGIRNRVLDALRAATFDSSPTYSDLNEAVEAHYWTEERLFSIIDEGSL